MRLTHQLLKAASSSSPLLLRNTQRSVPVNLPLLRRRTESLLRALRLEEYSLSLLLTGDRRVRQLNKQYRGKDKPTDVLSFPFQPLAPSTLPPDQRPLPPTLGDVRDLGEIVISVPYVARQIASGSIDPPPPSVDARLRTLVVHGVCHLLGYDHENDADAALMEAEETRLSELLDAEEAKSSEASQPEQSEQAQAKKT